MNDWRTTALSASSATSRSMSAKLTRSFPTGKFDKDASRYHQGVYSRKRLDLIKAIDTALSPLFMGQLKNVHKRCVAKFRTDLLNGLKVEGHDFGALVKQVGERVEKEFVDGAKGKQRQNSLRLLLTYIYI